MADDAWGPAPYELRLLERPGDKQQFNLLVQALMERSSPGGFYRLPWFGKVRRYETRKGWERIVRAHMGRVYELGRGNG